MFFIIKKYVASWKKMLYWLIESYVYLNSRQPFGVFGCHKRKLSVTCILQGQGVETCR